MTVEGERCAPSMALLYDAVSIYSERVKSFLLYDVVLDITELPRSLVGRRRLNMFVDLVTSWTTSFEESDIAKLPGNFWRISHSALYTFQNPDSTYKCTQFTSSFSEECNFDQEECLPRVSKLNSDCKTLVLR